MDSAANKTKRRTPGLVRDALDDIRSECYLSRKEWNVLVGIAEQRMDIQLALALAKLRDRIAEIERIANDALNGEQR